MTAHPKPVDGFEFLNPLDGGTYSLPPYETGKFADEIAAHPEFVPMISLSDALLNDDPQVGLDSLNEPTRALNVLMKRSIVKTLRNHLDADDPAWVALKALIDAFEFEILSKIFIDWRKHYGDIEVEPLGED